MGLLKWLLEKIVIYGIVITFFYFIGESIGIVPKPLKDLATWVQTNFPYIVFLICVIVVCYTIIRISSSRVEGE
jgi:type IV secretory pathway VirB2 component (pilin)